jgi:hypothetical protein
LRASSQSKDAAPKGPSVVLMPPAPKGASQLPPLASVKVATDKGAAGIELASNYALRSS